MAAKLLFLVIFVPIHSALSINMLHLAFNPPSGGLSALHKFFLVVITSPVLLPLVMSDPDGDRIPRLFQFLAYPVNSLVWGIGLLLVFALIKRWRARWRRGRDMTGRNLSDQSRGRQK
jgi:hypothetical protein